MRTALVALALILLAWPAWAAAEITLKDGTVLSGTDLELEGDVYVLRTSSDAALSIPWQLVTRVRLIGDDVPAPSGIRFTHAQQLAGPKEAPATPGYREQLGAFGRPPARFPQSPIPARWDPSSDIGEETDVTEFNPARWYRPPVDPVWTPRSAFSRADDRTEFNPARWYRAPVDSTWHPVDGFGGTRWFAPVVSEGD
ncbi:MAG TPA: hypothetical protein VFV75_02235 [Candidatus Polarisedimenticolaceae bacterium]|nr:hypothetical protein [Candidatus Polarisedimenticolaceae bacterium]